MKIVLIAAMDIEYQHLYESLGGSSEGCIGKHNLVISRSGIGKVNAALSASHLVDNHHPDVVISTGLAGGIGQNVNVGDVVVATATTYHDVWCGEPNVWGQIQGLPARFPADTTLLSAARRITPPELHQIHFGLVSTGDLFVTDAAVAQTVVDKLPETLSVDMESAAIAQVCYLHNTPFLSIRVISDTPLHTSNHSQQWSNFLVSMSETSFSFVKSLITAIY